MDKSIIKKRHITRLCHFTRTNNLPFILGDGNDSHEGIIANSLITDKSFLKPTDELRIDGKKDYICTSVQYPNGLYFNTIRNREKEKLFSEWVILEIDPEIIDETTLFCPVNAATERGKLIKSGSEAFEGMFNSIVYGKKIKRIDGNQKKKHEEQRVKYERSMFTPDNIPTNIQAEVMIKHKIPKENIKGLIFHNQNKAEKEKLRLELCGIDLSEIKIKYCEPLFEGNSINKALQDGALPEEGVLI